MKKFIIGALLIASSSSLFANETLLNTMKDMRNALVNINDGFLYNDKAKVLNGVDALEKAATIFQKKDLKTYLPENKKNMTPVAMSLSKKLNLSAEEIKTFANAGKLGQAAGVYPELVKTCTSCHAIIRGW
jgi:hypothetical protein